ncbi:MAG: methionine gamma-lyase family protein [Clostridiales bacterium]|jgi:cystathionine beta-lyase family protein involved in aluminum resistance|nr:methionine gamma-lyase family protein [Clostridiales bacterium]
MPQLTPADRFLHETYGVSEELLIMGREADTELSGVFSSINETASYNQLKVLAAMRDNRLSETHFAGSTGYGYNDAGRDVLERIYATVFGTEAALVRPQIISGTHAIATALFGNLRPGDELLSVTGRPYDTLLKVIGVSPATGSLMEHGIGYKEAPLTDGGIDYEAVKSLITPRVKIAAIQRSKGYAWRRSFTVEEINKLIDFIKSINRDIICFVDNCYGEFADVSEPRADLLAGSLIKNPGGGLAPVGGYIAGKEELVHAAACRLNTPGLGGEAGPTLGFTQAFLQGLFAAPQVVKGALMGAVFAARMFEKLGYEHMPGAFEKRSDIVQAAVLKTPSNVEAFCLGVQKAAPVDSFVKPEAWGMPGYSCPVIMAAGAFVQGSSIELSADAPMREPYIVFFQGGLSYDHSRAGVLAGLNELTMSLNRSIIHV